MADEPLIEIARGVNARVTQQVIEGNHLRNNRDVFSGIEWHSYEGNLQVEYRGRECIETRAVDDRILIPILELHCNLDALLLTNGSNSKNGGNIDESQAANFHMMALQLVTS